MYRRQFAVVLSHCLIVSAAAVAAGAAEKPAAKLLEVKKIWDAAPHNAFTDLTRFGGRWICTFREATAHGNAAGGSVRVIGSDDGRQWQSLATLSSKPNDLRDPKISLMPDGKMMLDTVTAFVKPQDVRHRSQTFFSKDGKQWEGPLAKGDDNFWLWRSTWHKQKCYVVGYSTGMPRGERSARLYTSTDGRKWKTLVQDFYKQGAPSEASLLFRQDDTCLCLLRHEAPARLGVARPPYDKWQWQTLNKRIGGPNLIELPFGIVAAGRVYEPSAHTSLLWLDPENGTLTELLKFPSGGDNSYPGLVWHDDLLWVSYYSSHEGKTSIYLAKVKFTK